MSEEKENQIITSIQYTQQTKKMIKKALEDKGASDLSSSNFRQYVNAINNLKTGSDTSEPMALLDDINGESIRQNYFEVLEDGSLINNSEKILEPHEFEGKTLTISRLIDSGNNSVQVIAKVTGIAETQDVTVQFDVNFIDVLGNTISNTDFIVASGTPTSGEMDINSSKTIGYPDDPIVAAYDYVINSVTVTPM